MSPALPSEDEEGFSAARNALVEGFEATAAGQGLGWVAAQVLDLKRGYLDEDLTRWTSSDVGEILLQLFPAKVVLEPGDLDDVVRGFAALLRHLGDEGMVDGAEAERLGAMVERLGPRFREAASDPSRWSVGKRLWSHAQEQGVDVSDQEAVQRFIDQFNRAPDEVRERVLGGPVPPVPSPGQVIPPLPPVVLPSQEELFSMAEDSGWVQRVRRLVEYVGEGRRLTDRGNLKLADGRDLIAILDTNDRFDPRIGDKVFKTRSTTELWGVDLTFRLAVAAGLLSIGYGKVSPGPNAGVVDDPPEALYGIWLSLIHQIGPTRYHYRRHAYRWDWYAEELDKALLPLLVEIYRQGSAEIEVLAEDVWHHLHDLFDLSDVPQDKLEFHRGLVEHSFRRALDLLGELGVVDVTDEVETPKGYGLTDRSGGEVTLTGLGKWTVQRLASTLTAAPVVGALRHESAAGLLRKASDLPSEEALAEVDAWIDHRGPEAAGLLVSALPTADETGRGLGFRALLRIGAAAGEEVARLREDPSLAPYATVWRIDTLSGDAGEMDCAGDPERFVRLLAAVDELWGTEGVVGSWAEGAAGAEGLEAMMDRVWRLDLPEAEQVLSAIGAHPDKSIAKSARRALFKRRSAGY